MRTPLYVAAAALAAALALPTAAQARTVRMHAFDCKTMGGAPIDYNYALQNDSSTSPMHVLCPIPDTSSFPKASIRELNLHGHNNYGNNGVGNSEQWGVVAQLCTSAWHTTGGSCTPYTASYIGYDYTLRFGRLGVALPWIEQNAGDFGYIHLILPPKTGNMRASFRGYYISDQ